MLYKPIIFWLMITVLSFYSAVAQSTDITYNRLQYHHYKWQVFHTRDFNIYFPKEYDSLCSYTARQLPAIKAVLKQRMFSESNNALNIILYPSNDQLYETNIGSYVPVRYTLPTVVLRGNRIVVAFNGDYEQLRQQLSEALARTTWEEQFDNSIGDQLKNTIVNDKIPAWCKEGMISYFANGWSIEQEDRLRKSCSENRFPDWYEVIRYQPKLSGVAFCYYLTRQYHPQAVSQLYQLLKKKKDINRAIRLVTKRNLQQTFYDCHEFYKTRFTREQQNELSRTGSAKNAIADDSVTISLAHSKGILKDVAISADGGYVSYVLHSNKKRSVYTVDKSTGKKRVVAAYKLPPWYDDLSNDVYPVIKWKPDKQELLVAYPDNGKLRLKSYAASGAELTERTLKYIDGITYLDTYDDDSQLLAAYRKGQSDIVIYDPRKERYKAITNDAYDDHEPVADRGTGNILFISKRQLKKDNYDPQIDKDSLYWVQGIFTSAHLKQPVISDTLPYVRWSKPVLFNNSNLLATHTRYGKEQFALILPSGARTLLGAYPSYCYSSKEHKLYFYRSSPDSLYITSVHSDEWINNRVNNINDTESCWLNDYLADAGRRAEEDSILNAAKAGNTPGFLEAVLKPKNSQELAQQRKDSLYQSSQYKAEGVEPYVLQLHSAYFTAKVNNDYFINKYQPYQSYQGQFKFPDVGGMVQGGFTDLFENHHFNMGYRLPAGTEGSDFFVCYQNAKKKADWGIKYFRKVESLQPDPGREWKDENGHEYPNTAKVKTHYYELSFLYPLNYYTAIDFNTAIRKDRTIFLATERYSLSFSPLKSLWSINTLSYSYNKLQPTLPMLCKGFSGKAMFDVFLGLQGAAKDAVYGASINLQYHQPVYNDITVVAGLKAGHSGGKQKVLYNMGGVDNNLTVRTDTSVHFSQNAPYAFQTLITPLRGFQQNSLYGNQYGLLNVDVYFPLFQSLIPIETNFSSVNNLQLGVFADIAYAKETWLPNAVGHSGISYGFSVRTLLAGYSIRADISLPNEANKKLLWYLSVDGLITGLR